MLRLATDADFNGTVLRGLLRRVPALDIVRVQDAGMSSADDPAVLAWAASEGRILLTHDRQTMIYHATARLKLGQPMPGLFVIRNTPGAIGRMLNEILLVALCSDQHEWTDQIVFLPV